MLVRLLARLSGAGRESYAVNRFEEAIVIEGQHWWLPHATVMQGSVVVRDVWGLSRWHALGRAIAWARRNAKAVRLTRWAESHVD